MKTPPYSIGINPQGPQEKLLFQLRTGRAYTLTELAHFSGMSKQETRNFLRKWRQKKRIKVRYTRKKPYYYIVNPELQKELKKEVCKKTSPPKGMKYCRHCYTHLGGYIGVKVTEALIYYQYLIPNQSVDYTVTQKGWLWVEKQGISRRELENTHKPIALQCLDFSERKSHLKGRLGQALLQLFRSKKYLKSISNSRAYRVTSKGVVFFKKELGLQLAQ